LKEMATRPVRREQTTLPNVIAIGGGVPIKVGNDVIGGVGLSGSPGRRRALRDGRHRQGQAAPAVSGRLVGWVARQCDTHRSRHRAGVARHDEA